MFQSTLFEENRRFDARVPTEMYVNAFLMDQPQRAVAVDISRTGLYLNALVQNPFPPRTPVGLEFKLPMIGETLWVAGETRHDSLDDYFYGLGIRFTNMAGLHQRMLREYCWRMRTGSTVRVRPTARPLTTWSAPKRP